MGWPRGVARDGSRRAIAIGDDEGRCWSCGRVFALDRFPPSQRLPGGSKGQCRDCSRSRQRKARGWIDGVVTSSVVAGALGVHGERVCEWGREGLIPSVRYGKQRRYVLSEVIRVLRERGWVAGAEMVRPGTAKARRRSDRHKGSAECLKCHRVLNVADDFIPSAVRKGQFVCRSCNGNRGDTLSDAYIKKLLSRHTGLRQRDIPPVMIEAKRLQMQIERRIAARKEKK